MFNETFHSLAQKTGTLSGQRLEATRAIIKAHTDFSQDIAKVDKAKYPTEEYFVRLVAAHLSRNQRLGIGHKRNILRTIRDMLIHSGPGEAKVVYGPKRWPAAPTPLL